MIPLMARKGTLMAVWGGLNDHRSDVELKLTLSQGVELSLPSLPTVCPRLDPLE